MSVKGIFKILIGTIVFIFVTSIMLEIYNISITSTMLKSNANLALEASADMFTQETYKLHNGVYSSERSNITSTGAGGEAFFITGKFYSGKTTESDIYKLLYSGPSATGFKKVADLVKGGTAVKFNAGTKEGTAKTAVRYVYRSSSVNNKLDRFKSHPNTSENRLRSSLTYCNWLYYGLYDNSTLNGIKDKYNNLGSTENIFDNYVDDKEDSLAYLYATSENAKKLKQKMVTPVNIGFPYFDAATLNKMFRFNLTEILMNGTKKSIQSHKGEEKTDGAMSSRKDQMYINYRGYALYVEDAYVSDIEYYVIDGYNDSTAAKKVGLAKLKNALHNNERVVKERSTGSDEDKERAKENTYVVVAKLKYKIPATYLGVTPLRKLFNYLHKREVKGFDGNIGEATEAPMESKMNGDLGSKYKYKVQQLSNDNSGENIDSFGEVYYVLVK